MFTGEQENLDYTNLVEKKKIE